MRDIRRTEKDIGLKIESRLLLLDFFPKLKQTIIAAEKVKGKIICRIQRKIKFVRNKKVNNLIAQNMSGSMIRQRKYLEETLGTVESSMRLKGGES